MGFKNKFLICALIYGFLLLGAYGLGIPFSVAADKKEIQLQKFKVTYMITYNTLSLEEAAEKEMIIRDKFQDACVVELDVKQTYNSNVMVFNLTDYITAQ